MAAQASWLQSAAAVFASSPAVACIGVTGIIWVEGNDLPPTDVLEPLVRAAFESALAGSLSGETERPVVRLSGARTNGATARFCFEACPAPLPKHALDDQRELVDARDALAARLHSEASCRGSARLLPALVEEFEAQAIPCFRCLLRIELDEAIGSPGEGLTESMKPGGSPSMVASAFKSWVPPLPLPAWPPLPKDAILSRARSFSASAFLAPVGEEAPGTSAQAPPSPTAANLNRNTELQARVMAKAVPFDSDLGRRLSNSKSQRRASVPANVQRGKGDELCREQV